MRRSLARGAALLGATALGVSLMAGAAMASVFDTYGFGARATAMGNAHAAAGQDFTAVYYNAAALTGAEHPEIAIGFDVVIPDLRIERDTPLDGDSPSSALPEPNLGAHVGFVVPLGGRIDDRLALGAGLYVPTIDVTRVDGIDPTRPHYYRHESLTDKLVLALGAAVEVHRTLSLGIGLQMLGALDGEALVHVDLVNRRFIRRTLAVDVKPTGAVTAGLLFTPSDRLRLGFSFRDALALDYNVIIGAQIDGVGELLVDMKGTSLYTPQQFTGGVAWDPDPSLTLTADLVWARWSAAPDPSSTFQVTLDTSSLGFDPIEVRTAPIELGAVDTVEPRFGAEWRPDDPWALRAGYAFKPTPLPAQTGPYNHADADAHQLAVGFAYLLRNPIALDRAPFSVEATGQLTMLESRRMEKTGDGDAVGSYTVGGPIWHAALTLRHIFY